MVTNGSHCWGRWRRSYPRVWVLPSARGNNNHSSPSPSYIGGRRALIDASPAGRRGRGGSPVRRVVSCRRAPGMLPVGGGGEGTVGEGDGGARGSGRQRGHGCQGWPLQPQLPSPPLPSSRPPPPSPSEAERGGGPGVGAPEEVGWACVSKRRAFSGGKGKYTAAAISPSGPPAAVLLPAGWLPGVVADIAFGPAPSGDMTSGEANIPGAGPKGSPWPPCPTAPCCPPARPRPGPMEPGAGCPYVSWWVG